MKNSWMYLIGVLCLGVTCPAHATAIVKTPQLIQIGVEVVEVDEVKTQKLGIQWLDTLHVFETDVPALLKIGTLSRSQIFFDLQAMLQQGAADILANPKLVTRDGTT